MAGRCWLESTLDRSSKLGLEVLQRAKRRSQTCKSERTSTLQNKQTGFGTKGNAEVQPFKTGKLLK